MLVLYLKYNMMVLEKYISVWYFRIFKSTDFEDFGEKKYLSLKESNACKEWRVQHYFLLSFIFQSRTQVRHLSQKCALPKAFGSNVPVEHTNCYIYRFQIPTSISNHCRTRFYARLTSKDLATTNRPCTQPWVGIPNTQANNEWENIVELAEKFPLN